jgi:hypothetical protein
MATSYYIAANGVETAVENLIVFTDTEFGCRIYMEGTKFIVNWTDYVANEWTEEYDLLSEALTRLAMLAACKEANWELGFGTSPEEHQVSVADFMEGTLQ